jgi:hypothetical protein
LGGKRGIGKDGRKLDNETKRAAFRLEFQRKDPMPDSPILIVHILAGTLGLLSGTAAIIFRKGSARHMLAGNVFVVAMLTMGVAAAYLAIVKNQPSNLGVGILTVYLVGTAWLTARRKDGETSRYDWIALLIPLAIGILRWMNGIDALRSGTGAKYGVPTGMHLFMGTFFLLACAGDIRMLTSGGVSRAKRISRHLWRMCYGLFIAAGSFFLGPSNRPLRLLSNLGIGKCLPPALFSTGVYLVLTLLPLVLLVFWLVRVRFKSANWGKPIPREGEVRSLRP